MNCAVFGNYARSHYSPYLDFPHTSRHYPFLEQFRFQKAKCETQLHVAVLVLRRKVLAFATNQNASRSRGASVRGSQNHIHAEKNLVSQVPRSLLRGASIYVLRVKQEHFHYSQPCPECTVVLEKCMKSYGLQNVFFSI